MLVMQSFDFSSDVSHNTWLNKEPSCLWFEMPCCSCDLTVITCALKRYDAVITQLMFPKIFILTTYIPLLWLYQPRPWFNIKMSSYQYRKSHYGDKTIPSYLHNEISYSGMKTSLYWIGAQTLLYIIPCWIQLCYNHSTVLLVWNYWLEWLVFVQRCRHFFIFIFSITLKWNNYVYANGYALYHFRWKQPGNHCF